MTKFMRITMVQSFTKIAVCSDDLEVMGITGDDLAQISAEVEAEVIATAQPGTSDVKCTVTSAEIIEVH